MIIINRNDNNRNDNLYEQINLNSYQECVSRNDFVSIIKNKDLFWTSFCKTAVSIPKGQWDGFKITLENNSVNIVAHQSNICLMKKLVEILRKIFEEALDNNSDFSIGFHKESRFIFGLFKEVSKTHSQEYIEDFAGKISSKALYSVIPSLAESCCTSCVKVNENKLIKNNSVPIEIMQMHWQPEVHLVSPIPLKTIPEQPELGDSLYELYKQNQLCDFVIICEETQKKFMIHAVVLYANGGEFFQKMLNTSMKETTDKRINFDAYSENTISALIDFIYLGGKKFQKNVAEGRPQVDLTELYVFAHAYRMDILKNCCVNLFCILSIPENAAQISELAKCYSDDDLKTLSLHLRNRKNH